MKIPQQTINTFNKLKTKVTLSHPYFAALKLGHRGYDQALEVNLAGQNLQRYDETSYRTSRALNDYCTFSEIVWKNAGASPIQTVIP